MASYYSDLGNSKSSDTRYNFRALLLGNRYSQLVSIDDQVRYMTMNAIFLVAIIPLTILGLANLNTSSVRAMSNFSIAIMCVISLALLRSKIPLKLIPVFTVTVYGAYHLFLVYSGTLDLWAAIGILAFPLIVFFLCEMFIGLIESGIVLLIMILFMFTPISSYSPPAQISIRFLFVYTFSLVLTIIYESVRLLKDRKETTLRTELAAERDIVSTMKDNINQGIFMMNRELKILQLYSKPLVAIFSYYDSELAGKNFLDMLSSSLDVKQLQTMKSYFEMVFSKSRSVKVLESANPIAEFEYKSDDKVKTLTTRFNLVEQTGSEPVIIGMIQDITREKEFAKELQTQKEAQELEMKNIFDVLQIDPLVFTDFIDDTDANFNFINSILKDRSLTTKQVLTKFFQNVHAMKSNALILGLETFGKKLHSLEDEIKLISGRDDISVEDIIDLTFKLETIMKEKDTYLKIVKKINAFKTSNQVDSVLVHSLTKAVEKVAEETQKKVELKAGHVDLRILESNLRKPIKDILFQCIRNSIYHGIEPVEERIAKNKKPKSLLVFSIKNTGGIAEVTFSDDGRGLDWEKIKKRYLALHPDAKDISKKILLGAIFTPEFSTSDETNLVAGRGIGLSLVKDLVKQYKGTIAVDSTDSGLTFKFTFPMAS